MSFFKQLSAVCEGITIGMSISMKDGLMTVSLVPQVSTNKIHPVTVKDATPEELDEKFVNELVTVLVENKAEIVNAKEMTDSLKKANKKTPEPPKYNKKEEKPVPRQEEKKEEEPPKVKHAPGFDF